MIDVPEILTAHGRLLARSFQAMRDGLGGVPARLVESICYSLDAGGKRLRPALIVECFLAVRPDQAVPDRLSPTTPPQPPEQTAPEQTAPEQTAPGQSVLSAMMAMELIHTFSLVHDDLPAMDDDDVRRGKPTNHKVFGEAMAILAGDAMMTLAFELIANYAEPAIVPLLIKELAHAAGPCGMIGGQVLDIDSENKQLDLPQLQQIHRMKTGALLTASCRLGAICARASETEIDDLTTFGKHLGLAFQIVDDVLDETSTPEQLGKATQKDRSRGKNTYPAMLGLEPSRDEAKRQLAFALHALTNLGARGERLAAIARFVVERTV